MVKKKIITIIFFILALAIITNATPDTNKYLLYLTMDLNKTINYKSVDLSTKYNNFTIGTAVKNSSFAKISYGYNFTTGSTQSVMNHTDDDDFDFTSTESFTYGYWVYYKTLVSQYNFGKKASPAGWFTYNSNAGLFQAGHRDATTTGCYITTANGYVATGQWYYFVVVVNKTGNKMHLYKNGVSTHNVSNADCSDDVSNTASMYIGNRIGGDTAGIDAYIDEAWVYNGTWTQPEILASYNSGNGTRPSFYGTGTTNFTITARGNDNNSTISNFSAKIDGTTYTTTTGTITTNISNTAGLKNITVIATNHYNYTKTNYNVTNNLNAQMTQYPTIDIYDIYYGTAIQEFNATISGTKYTTTNYTIYVPINTTEWTYIEAEGYISENTSHTYTNSNDLNQSMSRASATLYFVNEAGIASEQTGYVHNNNELWQTFNDTSTLILTSVYGADNRISVRFNLNDWENMSQFFEYISMDEIAVNATLTVLNKTDWSTVIQVLDPSNEPIQDVSVRVFQMVPRLHIEEPVTTTREIGRRLTDADGKVTFYLDSTSEVLIMTEKDGYTDTTTSMVVQDYSYTNTNPKLITIFPSQTELLQNMSIGIDGYFNNRSKNIYGIITAKEPYMTFYNDITYNIKYNTDYRIGLGQAPKQATYSLIDMNRWDFTLASGTDFDNTGNDNITLYTYYYDEDNTLLETATKEIIYINETRNNYFTEINENTTGTRIKNFTLFITLIIISTILGVLFKSPNIGTNTFLIGGVIIAIFSTSFIMLALINMIYYAIRIVKRLISE